VTTLRDRADAAAQVFVECLEAPVPGADDAHHLRRVLRLRDGEHVVACDGAGSWRRCAVHGEGLEPIGPIVADPPVDAPVAVWLPALKGDRAEWAVAKLTELGVDEIGLLSCVRGTVRLDEAGAARVLSRWRRVAREAAAQSRRTRLPALVGPCGVGAAADGGAVRCDLDGALDAGGARALLVGPEGGWADDERAGAAASVSLGDTVLRTETAAVTAAVLLCAARRSARHDAGLEAQ
jgi:16S rRNA (uracil1498-N3)-methyltransferase